jgi:hypothetical protein
MTAPGLISQLAILALLVCLTICVHGAAMLIVIKHSARRLAAMGEDPVPLARITSIIAAIFVMMAAHLVEMAAWGLAIYILGLIPDPYDSFLYSMESYTTLGPRDAQLPQPWRWMTGWVAATGILMFAWSTAILTSILNRIVSGTRLLP